MKTEDCSRMIQRCIEAYGITKDNDPYVCVTWDNSQYKEYHPINMFDRDDGDVALAICGTEKLTNCESCGPTQHYLRKDVYRVDRAIGETMKFSSFVKNIGDHELKFLIATTSDGYPQNIIGEINPHRTEMIVNRDGTKFIVFHWDTRDGGEGPDNSSEMTFNECTKF